MMKESLMSGLIFLITSDLRSTITFYKSELGMDLWLDQGDCAVMQHGNLLLGFCERSSGSFEGIITMFYETREEVDMVYQKLQDLAEGPPKENEAYRIYHFFARDPEGRQLEFQAFLHALQPYLSGLDLLETRRSIRQFKGESVPEELLWQVFETCRWAPSSRNTQGITYTVIREREAIHYLADLRGSSSAPIAAAPMAVAVSADPEITSRPEQDACIAAYHLTLAARLHGLGTCWMGGMNRDEVKKRLGLPVEHYLATATPLGYPAERPHVKPRKPAKSYVRILD
jgi:nitroreductase/catechol 2,3-dioxygenase-like lactoylglutathione lyase family enzyme